MAGVSAAPERSEVAMNQPRKILIVRDLPGIVELEVKLLLERNAYDGAAEDFCKETALKLFGVWVTEESEIFEQTREATFASHGLADDEVMVVMMSLGIDFSDASGNPLRCTRGLAMSAEFAARGIAGKLPDQNTDRFAFNLERQRDAFMARKRSQ